MVVKSGDAEFAKSEKRRCDFRPIEVSDKEMKSDPISYPFRTK